MNQRETSFLLSSAVLNIALRQKCLSQFTNDAAASEKMSAKFTKNLGIDENLTSGPIFRDSSYHNKIKGH